MHAAFSVIVFTVLSGTGLGAIALIAADDLYGAITAHVGPLHAWNVAATLALALVIAGLGASALHLANPQNAWRSATRFRTSWLSREAVFSILFVVIAFAYLALRWAGIEGLLRNVVACLSLLLAWTVVYCTAMIYASLKPIRAWHTWRVPLAYLLLAHAAGAVVVMAVLRSFDAPLAQLPAIAGMLIVAAALSKWNHRLYLGGDCGRVTLESALGVAHGVRPNTGPATVAARLLDVGHSRGTFLTREFCVTPTPGRQVAALWMMAIGLFSLPLLWILIAPRSPVWAALACAAMIAGLFAERWLFFVEARHTVRLYHGERRV
ncbi:MAG: DmsC/YnfH family molybdoenzyme membrane anchor subunit [Casimicrobiaceae bacterium]